MFVVLSYNKISILNNFFNNIIRLNSKEEGAKNTSLNDTISEKVCLSILTHWVRLCEIN